MMGLFYCCWRRDRFRPKFKLSPSTSDDIEQSRPSNASVRATGTIHLVEEKVLVHFSHEEKIECHRWVLDTGATNHMTGCKTAFSGLDRNIYDIVKFGDGLVVKIEGMGTILFSCKNSEHRAFAGVYFIPMLTTNIISVDQLNEIGSRRSLREES
jgi:hypothetical protein